MTQEQTQAIETTNASLNITNAEVGTMVTSFKANPKDRALSAKIFNALNNPTEKISAHINEEIEVENYLVEMVQIEDVDDFGNSLESFSKVPRVVLVSPDGTSYQAVSYGMANVLRNIIAVAGDAPWSPAIGLKIKQVPTKNGSMLTAEMVQCLQPTR